MENEQKTLDKQTAKFVAACIENLPKISGETMQEWIINPKKLQTRLSILKRKKIAVVGGSLEFLNNFYHSATIFLGENLGEQGHEYSAIRKWYEDSDRIVFVNFSSYMLDGSSEVAETYGANTTPYGETLKFERVFSSSELEKFELFVFDQKFLDEFKEKDEEKYKYFMEFFEPKRRIRGEIIPNQFVLRK